MKLKQLIEKLDIISMTADPETEISGICHDSREAVPGSLFVAIAGFESDGHRFIPAAVKNGAAAILCQTPPEDGTPYIIDWSHAAQGDAAADAARTFLLFWLNGDITGAEEYLKMFCEKSKTEIKYVKKWMPMVSAVRMLNNVAAEREFLYSWIDA